MKYQLSADHITITAADRELMDKKLDRLEKLVETPYVLDVRIVHDTHHGKGDVVTCILNLEQGKKVFHAERSDSSIQNALDQSLAALIQEIKHYQGKKGRQAAS